MMNSQRPLVYWASHLNVYLNPFTYPARKASPLFSSPCRNRVDNYLGMCYTCLESSKFPCPQDRKWRLLRTHCMNTLGTIAQFVSTYRWSLEFIVTAAREYILYVSCKIVISRNLFLSQELRTSRRNFMAQVKGILWKAVGGDCHFNILSGIIFALLSLCYSCFSLKRV